MLRVSGSKIISLIMSVVLVCTMFSIPAGAVPAKVDIGLGVSLEGSGDRLTELTTERGENVVVSIMSPVLPDDADSVWLRVYYDPNVLEFVNWLTTVPDGDYRAEYSGAGIDLDTGETFLGAALSSGQEKNIPTEGGFRISALMRTKPTARVKQTALDLRLYTVSYTIEGNVKEHVELWNDIYTTNTGALIKFTNLPYENAKTGGGIYANKEKLDNGEEVEITVRIPQIAWDANPANVEVTYDPDDFEFVYWKESVGETYENVGRYGVNFRNNAPELDNAIELVAVLRAKNRSVQKTSTIGLTPNIWYEGATLWYRLDSTSVDIKLTGLPVNGDGLKVSSASVKRGETVDAIVEIPAFARTADNISLQVKFDPKVFQVVSWEPTAEGHSITSNYDNINGNFSLNINGATTPIDMSAGWAFSATLKAKEDAALGGSELDLATHSVMITEYSTVDSVWAPANDRIIVSVNVYDDYPVYGGGLSFSKTSLVSDETFKVYVKVPAMYATADKLDVTVSFDPDDFDVTVVDPGNNAIEVSVSDNSFTFSTKNAPGVNIDLKDGLVLTADMKVSRDATGGDHYFALTAYEIKSGETVLWEPAVKRDAVNVTVTTSYPVSGGGISSAKKTARPEDKFDVTVTVPPISAAADYVGIEVRYDTSAFDVISWQYSHNGVDVKNEAGYFGIYGNALIQPIDLSHGLTLTANVRVKSDAPKGSYTFTLKTYDLSYKKKTGGITTLWSPDTISTPVRVLSADEKFPVAGGGISLSETYINPGDTVTATVTVPSIGAFVNNGTVRVDFDSSAFEIISLSSDKAAFTGKENTGYYTFTASNVNVDFSAGAKFYATLKAKSKASGSYTFTLSRTSSLTTSENGYSEDVWQPEVYSAALAVAVGGFPVTTGGIAVSKSSVARNGSFNVTVTVPAMKAVVSDLYVTVTFDSSAFEVTSWKPNVSGAEATDGIGYFTLEMTGGSLDLSRGLTLTAKMKALKYADIDTYSFDLLYHDIDGVPKGDVYSRYLWEPSKTAVDVKVTSGGGSVYPDPDPYDPDIYGYPVRGGGISLSRTELIEGELFTLYLNIPAIELYATNGAVTVQFDSSAFEVVSWQPNVSGMNGTYGAGYISLSVSDYYGADLYRGASMTASMRVKSGAAGRYSFSLTTASLRNGTQSLWTPVNTYISAYVYGTGSYNNYHDPWYYYYPANTTHGPGQNNPPFPTIQPPPTTQATTSTEPTVITVIIEEPVNDSRTSYPDTDPDDEDEVITSDDDTTTVVVPDRKANVSLSSALDGVNNSRIRAKTDAVRFSSDTIIYLRNTAEADQSAAAALKTLRLSDHRSYAFDISVYDTGSGKFIHYIPGGYIDLNIPIPDSLAVDSGDIAVYHVQDGVPEAIDSVIINEDGMRKIHFRATSFSPYMFVDLVNLKQTEQIIQPKDNKDNTGAYIVDDDSGRNANPHTGDVAAWIIIPAAVAVCVILAGKSRKRKRSSRR